MNLTRFLVLPSAIAVACLVAAPILPGVAQTEPAPMQRMKRFKNNLNLSPEQQQAMERIKTSTRTQIDQVLTEELTPDQLRAWQTARTNRQKPDFAALNLSVEKQQQIRARIRTIREASKAEMKKVLTADQQQQLEQRRQMKRQTSGNQQRQNRRLQSPVQVQPSTAQ